MLNKHRAISKFLIVAIPFIFLLASAYSNYNVLIEADFIAHGKKYEATDTDDLWADKQINLDFIPSGSFVIPSSGMSLHGLLTTPQAVASINSLFSVLRC